jgi:hypothetical protein
MGVEAEISGGHLYSLIESLRGHLYRENISYDYMLKY